MRFLLTLTVCLALGAPFAQAEDLPRLTGWVVDTAQTLPAEERGRLAATLSRHEERTGTRLIVAVVPTLMGQAPADYALRLLHHWNLSPHGGLVVLAVEDKTVRIQVGAALRERWPDALTQRIIEERMLPPFREGRYADGLMAGISTLTDQPLPAKAAVPVNQRRGRWVYGVIVAVMGFFVVMGYAYLLPPQTRANQC
jgi:uncharacterized protein